MYLEGVINEIESGTLWLKNCEGFALGYRSSMTLIYDKNLSMSNKSNCFCPSSVSFDKDSNVMLKLD